MRDTAKGVISLELKGIEIYFIYTRYKKTQIILQASSEYLPRIPA